MPRSHPPKLFPKPQLCQGKHRYSSEQEARQQAEAQELLNFAQDLQLSVYRCHLCGDWHLTRQQKSVY